MNRSRTIWRAAACSLSVGLALATGCASSGSSGSRGLQQAIAEYDAESYQAAHREAKAIQEQSTGVRRDEAAYVAGLSAYRLGWQSEAETELVVAARSSDEQTKAMAQATLGLIRLEQNRMTEAGSLLQDAAEDLEGDDAAMAARYASRAGGGSDSYAYRSTATPVSVRSSGGVFTLQIGAFSDRERAESAARVVRSSSAARGYGEIQIASRVDGRGQTLYHVQLGRFNTRDAAATARRRLGHPEYIVVAAR